MRSSVFNPITYASILLIWSLLAIPCFAGECETRGSCYITPEGSGARTGVDWNNAYAGFAATQCSVAYYLAGGTYDYTSTSTTISGACTSGSPLIIYKAVSGGPGNPQNVAGWSASYGTSQATFSQTEDADPAKTYRPFFTLSGTFITMDGVVPTSGTPSKTATYGIHLQSRNNVEYAFIVVTGANSTVKHIEFDGVAVSYGYQVTACNRASSVVTATLSPAPRLVVGDRIDMVMAGGTPTDFSTPTSGSGIGLTSVSGSQVQYTQAGADEPCSVVTASHLNENYSFQGPLYANITANPATLLFADNYIHDIPGSILLKSCYSCTFTRNYHSRNRVTPTEHENAIDGPIFNNSTVSNSIFEDISGTSNIVPTCGVTCNWTSDAIVNNLFFCTLAADSNAAVPYASPQCLNSSLVSDDNGSNQVTSLLVYGNTFVERSSAANCKIVYSNASSTATVENNVVYCPNATLVLAASTHDYNTSFTATNNNAPTPSTHEYFYCWPAGSFCNNTGNKIQYNFADPFVNDSDNTENFRLSSEAVNPHLNDGLTLSAPYNLDFLGNTRSADGTWERGAFEFVRPNPGQSPN
jgi:hypothetical protein